MSHDIEAEQVVREYPLHTGEPDNWYAVEIVYTRYVPDAAGKVVMDPGSYVVCRTSVEDFVTALRKQEPLPKECYRRKRSEEDPQLEGPLDTYVGAKCYVVLELAPSLGRHFAKGRPGVTTKEDYGDANWGLRHVMPDGTILKESGPNGDDCRIVYFGVEKRLPYQHQKFRLHLHPDKKRQDPDYIDPDIPNDGGRFPIYDRSPCMASQEGAPDCRH